MGMQEGPAQACTFFSSKPVQPKPDGCAGRGARRARDFTPVPQQTSMDFLQVWFVCVSLQARPSAGFSYMETAPSGTSASSAMKLLYLWYKAGNASTEWN
jgi:hypothetical protein